MPEPHTGAGPSFPWKISPPLQRKLLRLRSVFFPLYWGNRYEQIGKRPSVVELKVTQALLAVVQLTRGSASAGDFVPLASRQRILQRFHAFRVAPFDFSTTRKSTLPSLRALWVVHPKDFDVLPWSVEALLRHSLNPVTEVHIITPDVEGAKNSLPPHVMSQAPVTFRNDSELIDRETSKILDSAFGSHSGWAKQQIIKVLASLEEGPTNTLVIDSDTILLQDKAWLLPGNVQLLYFRAFINPRYHDYLEEWGLRKIDRNRSFVTHHMLFQADMLKKILVARFTSTEPRSIARALARSSQRLGFPEFSLDYELYGQAMALEHPENLIWDKYSNLGISRPQEMGSWESLIQSLRDEGNFNSVSFHLPNR